MPGLQLSLLGSFEARAGEAHPLTIASRKERALLAYLAVAGPRAHGRDTLAALLWGGVGEEQARQSLRKALSDLRQALGRAASALSIDGETVTLTARVDVLEFQALARDGRPEALRRATALYRGDLLENVRVREPAFDQWLIRERERLRLLSEAALDQLFAHESIRGSVEGAVDIALRLLALNPAHEIAHRYLIRSYARQGRRDAALRQYRACADALWRDLHVKPGPDTERAYREVMVGRRRERPKVLVVEDEIVTRTMLQELLTKAGHDVVVAADGADALFQFGHDSFDLVVADIWMPVLDGMQLLEVVRSKRPDVPVVMITGRGNAKLEARCLAMGAADYVTKPFSVPALLARIEKATQRARLASPS